MRNMKTLIIAAAATLAAASALAFERGQGPCATDGTQCDSPRAGMQRGAKGHNPMRMFKQLNLNEKQQAQVKELFESAKTEKQAKREAHRLQMQEFLNNPDYPVADMQAARKAHREAAQQERLEMKRAVYQVLTPEQREKAQQLRQQGPKGKKGMKRGGNKGPQRGW